MSPTTINSRATKIELAIGDRIVRASGGRPTGATGRIGLFLERNGVVFAASTFPVTGAREQIFVVTPEESLTPIGRSSELRECFGEGDANIVVSSAELISVVALSSAEPVRSLRDNKFAVPEAVPADESFDCQALLLRGVGAPGARGRVRDARAFARLRLSPGDGPLTVGDLIEIAPTVGRSFGQSGDSGALVKLGASDELLGLLLGAAPDGTGLVAPLHAFLRREGFSVFPHARIRVDVTEASFSSALDPLLEALGRRENLDDALSRHASAVRAYFSERALTDAPQAVTSERERFVATVMRSLDAEGLRDFVRRLEAGPLALEREGLDWFLELLFAHQDLIKIDKVEPGAVSGRLLGTPFKIANWLQRRSAPQTPEAAGALSAGVTVAAQRGGENTPQELAAAVGDGIAWR